ncbi:MAG TPA: O-antigen ligase family protein [bacterium]|nr:O-antigen ligase family protein [bacterium]
MNSMSGRFETVRLNTALLILISLAVLVGVATGIQSSFNMESFFRGLVLANLVLVGYLVLLRSVVGGLVIYLYSLVFLNYYWRIVVPGVWPDIDIPRMMFVFVWLVFILEVLVRQKRLLPNASMGLAMLFLMAVFVASMITHRKPSIREFLNGYVIPYAMFVICKNVFVSRRDVERFIFWLAVPLAFYFPATSILEHFRVTALLFPRYIGTAMTGEVPVYWGARAMGAFVQPVATGFASIAIYVLAMHILSMSRRAAARIYSLVISAITPIGIFYTYTRSVYLGFLGAILVLFVFSRRLRVVALVLIVGMGLAVLGNWTNMTTANREAGGLGDVETAQARVVLAHASLNMFMDHPFFGVGFTCFIANAQPYVGQVRHTFLGYKEEWIAEYTQEHNQFLSVLTETGLAGFVPYLLVYIFLVTTLVKARRRTIGLYDPEFVISVWAVMVAYVAQMLFIEPRFFEFMNALPFMLAGIVAGGYQRAMAERSVDHRGNEGLLRKEYAT